MFEIHAFVRELPALIALTLFCGMVLFWSAFWSGLL